MAVWVEEDSIFYLIFSSFTSPDDVVAVPSRQFGDFLIAEWAETALLFPEQEQLPFPFQVVCHFHIETFFKIRLPGGVIGIGITLDFDMPFDGYAGSFEQSNGVHGSVLSEYFSLKYPVLTSNGRKVFLLHPCGRFVRMSPFCPSP